MGRRGPAPKPTALRMLHGDRKDRINTSEPVPAASDVVPPCDLGERAAGIWDRLAPDLIARGVLTAWDVDAFASCCLSLAQYREATELVAEHGLLALGVGGSLVKSPAVALQESADARFARWAARFGLTPSDRSQLKIGSGAHVQAAGPERLLTS